jgi:hypothetical protein
LREGATVAVQPGKPLAVLEEIGLTAADLWLAERILWVEGVSEVEIAGVVIDSSDDARVKGIKVHPLPATSRFAARGSKGAERTFEFLRRVTGAVTPLPLTMLFLFDADEKSEEVKREISRASGNRARFLPVREVENLLVHGPSIQALLAQRCKEFGLEAPSLSDIEGEIDSQLAKRDDRQLYPHGLSDPAAARETVVGSEVLDRLYARFLTAEYRKVMDGAELARLVEQNSPAQLGPLREILAELGAQES